MSWKGPIFVSVEVIPKANFPPNYLSEGLLSRFSPNLTLFNGLNTDYQFLVFDHSYVILLQYILE